MNAEDLEVGHVIKLEADYGGCRTSYWLVTEVMKPFISYVRFSCTCGDIACGHWMKDVKRQEIDTLGEYEDDPVFVLVPHEDTYDWSRITNDE